MAKDRNDTKTRSLILNANASRQAEFKRKKRDEGFVQKLLWVEKDGFEAGSRAAEKHKDGYRGSDVFGTMQNGYDQRSWKLGFYATLDSDELPTV